MNLISRPITNLEEFEKALQNASLDKTEREIIDYIRYIGIFNQPILYKDLNIETKPPVLSRLCESCRKIGKNMPDHFEQVRKWSTLISDENVRWDGNLICCYALNIDGEKLIPEMNTTQFHTFVVHKELFTGI